MISNICIACLSVAMVVIMFHPLSEQFPSTMSDAEKSTAVILIMGFFGVIAAIKETRK